MRLSDIGEEALIERIVSEHRLPTSEPGLVVGVGDDAAVLDLGGERLTVFTTDMLVEGSDYRRDIITPFQLGWKSIAANISDIAAMGGVPSWSLVSLGLREDTDVRFVDQLYRGMTECAARFGSTLIGGDTNSVTGSEVISVSQLGWVEPGNVARRNGARPGDRILVTGWLGNSLAGLQLLFRFGLEEAADKSAWLVQSHLMPVARVAEARAAVATGAVRAMMDLSDGLGADLPKLCKASGVGAVVYADKLPISDDLRAASEMLEVEPVEIASGGGEEFELLMACAPEDAGRIAEAVETSTGTRVHDIGEFTDEGIRVLRPDGCRHALAPGWQHFA